MRVVKVYLGPFNGWDMEGMEVADEVVLMVIIV